MQGESPTGQGGMRPTTGIHRCDLTLDDEGIRPRRRGSARVGTMVCAARTYAVGTAESRRPVPGQGWRPGTDDADRGVGYPEVCAILRTSTVCPLELRGRRIVLAPLVDAEISGLKSSPFDRTGMPSSTRRSKS